MANRDGYIQMETGKAVVDLSRVAEIALKKLAPKNEPVERDFKVLSQTWLSIGK